MAPKLEDFIPVVRFHGLNSAKNGTLSGVMAFTGASTHTGVETHTGAETHSGAETHTGAERFTSIGPTAPIDETTATLSVTQALHAGGVIAMNRAAGVTCTLPAATGTGDTYTFFITTAATSNANIIKVANATDVMDGSLALQADTDSDGTSKTWMAEVGDDTITMAGAATTGGIAGGRITCTDYESGFWSCFSLTISGGGSEATPFSATVA